MSIPQEYDYIGLSEPLPTDKTVQPSPSSNADKNNGFNLKETELRLGLGLGLPGSQPPERKGGAGVSLFGKELKDETKCGFSQKSFVSGAKRGFSDAINGAGKWSLSINGGSETDKGKSEALFSPRGVNIAANNSSVNGSSVKKEIPAVKPAEERKNEPSNTAPASKAQVVGWPPIRSFRKNSLSTNIRKDEDGHGGGKGGCHCLYVKVSMDGAPYLRKIDLKTYSTYADLSSALEKMFSCFTIGQYGQGAAGKELSHLMDLLHGSEYVLTYEDKDADWMLVGDVPWEMFTDTCRRLRIMKGSDAIGLAPRTMQKCKSQN